MLSAVDFLLYLFPLIAAVVYGYSAYTAIAISRTLSNRVYRNQALGMAAIGIILVILAAWITFGPPTSQHLTGIVYFLQFLGTWMAVALGFYYYIDASIMAARVTDPLFRDTLHWTRLRLVLWACDIAIAGIFSITGAVGSFSYGNGPPIIVDWIGVPFYIAVFSGAVALPIAAKRSKDGVLRRQLSWFVACPILSILAFYVGGLVGILTSAFIGDLAGVVMYTAAAYFLYRSVISLVPVYEFKEGLGKSG